jgi:Na+/proline symporter
VSENTAIVLLALLAYAMAAFLLAGCAYLILAHGWSWWWMLLAAMCIPVVRLQPEGKS